VVVIDAARRQFVSTHARRTLDAVKSDQLWKPTVKSGNELLGPDIPVVVLLILTSVNLLLLLTLLMPE
jgi:hypothetical protein